MSDYLKEKVERNEERESEGATKAKVRYAENETREHEDHLRHFQVRLKRRMVSLSFLFSFCRK